MSKAFGDVGWNEQVMLPGDSLKSPNGAASVSVGNTGSVTLSYSGQSLTVATTDQIPTVPTISTSVTTDAASDTKTVSPKAVKDFVEGKGYLTVEAGPRYALYSPTVTTSTTDSSNDTISATLQDRSINAVTIGSGVDYAVFTFPASVSGYARDFFIRLTITLQDASDLQLTFQEPGGTSVSFDAADEEWSAVEPGVNILMFTETSQS